jgi:hypothetical protein
MLQAMEQAMREKLAERTQGGAFQLRKAFKFFDRDGRSPASYVMSHET